MRMKKIKCLLVFLILFTMVFSNGNAEAYSSSTDENLPKVKLSEGIKENMKDFIVTEMDVPEIAKVIKNRENTIEMNDNNIVRQYRTHFYKKAAKKKKRTYKWQYLYTVEPFSFYKNRKTGQIRAKQTTSTLVHTANTVVSGVGTRRSSFPIPYYNAKFVGLLG